MKHFFTLLGLGILASITLYTDSFSQTRPDIEWSRCYGGSRDENGSGGVNWKSLLPTSDGGYIIAGETSSINGDIDKSKRRDDMFPQDSFNNDDVWLVKMSNTGEKEWEKYYGGSLGDFVNMMKPTSDGGYILCGITNSIDGDFPFDTTGVIEVFIKGGVNDGYVMKLDSLCNKEWVSRIGGTGVDQLYSIIQTSDGGYLAAGYTYSKDEIWLGYSWVKDNSPYQNGFIAKLDANGIKKWNKLYGGSKEDVLYDVALTPNGFLLCGFSASADGDISAPHYKDTINKENPSGDCWIIETDKDGNILREKCFGGSKRDVGDGIIVLNDGYVVKSNTLSPDVEVKGYHPARTGLDYLPFDSWIFKVDTNWNIVWQNCIGGSQQDVITTLIPKSEGGFTFIGATNSSDSDLINMRPLSTAGEKQMDIWIGEISEEGKLLWHSCYGGSHNDLGNGIVRNTDGGYTLFTSVGSNDGDITGNHGGSPAHNRDIWIAKLKKAQNSVEAYSGGSQFANPYPNPSVNEMNLYIHPTQPVQTVQYFNPLGQEFYPKYQLSGNLLTTDTRSLAKGMYIIRITYQDLSVQEVRKFVKVE